MNKETLELEISKVLEKLPTKLRLSGAGISDISMYYLQTKNEDIAELIIILRNDSVILELFDDKMFNTGNGASLITVDSLARWLVGIAHLKGINTAIEHLDSFLISAGTPCWNVLAISGITIEKEIIINERTKLISFDELPDSYAKDALSPPFLKPEFALKLGFIPHHSHNSYRPPAAALIQDAIIKPKSYSRENMAFNSNDFKPLYEFCEFLTLINASTPVAVGAWCDLPESTPCKQLFGGGWSWPVVDVLSRTDMILTQQDWDKSCEFYQKFISLSQDVRDLLRVPIERINQARRRSNLADRAIDLGVACEALLLNDKPHNEQISFTLRLRAALLLGSTFEERQELLNFFSAFYACRSQAAHTGKLDTKIKVAYRGKLDASTVLQEGDNHCINAILSIINLGSFPNWNELMLKKEFA